MECGGTTDGGAKDGGGAGGGCGWLGWGAGIVGAGEFGRRHWLRWVDAGGALSAGGARLTNLVTQACDAPIGGGGVDRGHDARIETVTLLEGFVKRELADLGAHRRLGELGDRVMWIINTVGCFVCVHDLGSGDGMGLGRFGGVRLGGGGDWMLGAWR